MTPPVRTIQLSAYYDAAAHTKEQDYGHFTAICSEDFYFSSTLRAIALGRLRREQRNNPYLCGLTNKFPEAIGQSNLRSRSSDKKYNDAKDAWWYRRRRRVTACGLSRRGLEKLVVRELLVAGEIFLVKLRNGRLQVIPSEFCGSGSQPSSREINGILYGPGDVPRAYRFGRMSAAGVIIYDDATPVPAEHVIHVFDRDRVMMGRGLPWLLASLRTARDLYEITRTKTKQIKDANVISGWIEKAGATEFLKGLGAVTETDDAGAPAKEAESDPAEPSAKGPLVVELKPGTFIALEPGEKLNQLMSQYQAADYKELIMIMLHAIATPVGLPVELWFSGLGEVNYSGYKGLGVQWDGRRRDIIGFLTDHFLDPWHLWLAEYAEQHEGLPPHPDRDHELVDWMFRRTPVLDEEKNARANRLRLESGETDLAQIWEENGEYAEEVFARRRQLWIKALVAAGTLKEGDDPGVVVVPIEFILKGRLPGERAGVPAVAGTGATPVDDEAADRRREAAGE